MTATSLIAQPASIQDSLRQNLDAHVACMSALLELLGREHQALLGSEAAALEQVSSEKSRAVAQLQKLSLQLSALPGIGGGAALEQAIARAGGELLRLWQELMTLAARCQQANITNGALIDARQAQVRWTLRHMLGGGTSAARTYGRSGISRDDGARRILASA